MRFLAAEKLSEHKYKTPEGYLVCVDAVLSRTGKQKYMRSELFGDECKNPTDEVEVDRLEADVFEEKAMASFENKLFCLEDTDEDVNVANHNDLSVGFVRDIKRGTDNGQPVMLGTLVITDENAIDLVESGEYAELSCGYDCDIADDEHPTQRNIRGNHVALCKQGRAGIARIVDSVKDAWTQERFEELIDEAETKRELDLVISFMTSKKSDTVWQTADAYRKLVEKADTKKTALADTNDFAVMRFAFSTNIAAFERAIVNNDIAEFNAMLPTFEKDIADYHKWKAEGKLSAADIGKVKRQVDKINNLLAKSSINKRFEVKDMATLKDDEYVQLPRGRFKLVAKTKEELEKEGYGYHHSDNGYSVYVKNNSAVAIKDSVRANDAIEKNFEIYVKNAFGAYKVADWSAVSKEAAVKEFLAANPSYRNKGIIEARDSTDSKRDGMKDADYEQWTKQGWRVVALYKDGGRIHAIVERKSGDFVVALGYNTSTGEWAQGRYVSTFGAAVDTLNEEKPGAVPIRDAKPTKKTFEVSFVKDDVTYVRKVKADSLQDAIVKAKDEVSTAHKVVVFTQNLLSEMGKNNSIGKYDRVVSAMRQLYGQSLLPDDKLKEAIRRELPRLLKKYVNE